MTISRLCCPNCSTKVHVPAARSNVKCPSCGTIWSPANPGAAKTDSRAARPARASAYDPGNSKRRVAMIAGIVAGLVLIIAVAGISIYFFTGPGDSPDPSSDEAVPSSPQGSKSESVADEPAEAEPYRTVDLPEPQRRQIYDDYRTAAKSTVEQPIPLPQQTQIRASVDSTMEKILEREIRTFATLHDIEIDDVREIIKEGNAKEWYRR